MNLVELDHALRKLCLSGMAAVLGIRLRHAQTEKLTPIVSCRRSSPTSSCVKCGPRSWRTKVHTDLRPDDATK